MREAEGAAAPAAALTKYRWRSARPGSMSVASSSPGAPGRPGQAPAPGRSTEQPGSMLRHRDSSVLDG